MTMELIPGLAGVPAAISKIANINGEEGKLYYRGYSIEDLAANTTYEETAYLLFFGELPNAEQLADFDAKLKEARAIKPFLIEILKAMPKTGHPMAAIQSAVAALGMAYDADDVENKEVQLDNAIRLVAKLPTIMAAFIRIRDGKEPIAPNNELSHAANFLYMLNGEVPKPIVAKTMDATLILHAEHTMNASTFTGRVVGSTLATPYAVVSAAIGSLSGPLHGGANERVLVMLDEIGTLENTTPYLQEKIEKREKIMGLGHRVYKAKDPRAHVLQGLVEQVFAELGSDTRYDIARKIEEITAEKLAPRGIYPNVDFYSGVLYAKLGIPADIFTPIFAISRVSGWLAHWIEQLENNRIFRPKALYDGPAFRTIEK